MVRFVLLILAAVSLCVPAWAQKETRIALVIGNGAYQHADPLRNPVNDARAMAKVLRDAGFEVIVSENATRRALIASLREFSGKLAPGGVGLFYYAGHGMQVRGANYLIPIDAALGSEDELRYETIDLNDVLGRFDEARTRLSLVILDACRDNPFARKFRSTSRGLAQTDAPRGTVIAYATAPGDTAADGDGENGVYTTELLKAIAQPGLKLEEVFKRTIDGVARATANKQTPWVSSSFRGDFVFTAAAAAAAPPPPVAQPAPFVPEQLELAAWNAIATSSNPAMFELFLKRFPNGVYADFARAKLEELRAAEARSAQQEEARQAAAAEEAKRKADADARQAAAAEARRRAELEEAKRRVEADARRKADAEEAARLAAADEAKHRAAGEARRAANRADDEEAQRILAADAKRRADAEAKRADQEARWAAAAEEAKRRLAADDEKKAVENAEAALKLADIDRKRIQAALTSKGFDTQGTDGAFGPRTRLMIANWQRSRNEAPTGYLTATQAALLSQEGQSALARIEDERKKADEDKRKADAERAKAAPPAQQTIAAPAPPPSPPSPPSPTTNFDGRWSGTAVDLGVMLEVTGQRARLSLFCNSGTSVSNFTLGADGAVDTSIGGGAGGMARRRVTGRLPTLSIEFAATCRGGTVTLVR